MTAFNIDLTTDQPDRIYVEIDRRFDVAIERTEAGLSLRIYPRTDGELWDEPFTTFEVDEAEVIALEREMGTQARRTPRENRFTPPARLWQSATIRRKAMLDLSASSSFVDETLGTVDVSEASRNATIEPMARHPRKAYERKFADFLFLLRATREELVVVHHPEVLGDNYQEIIESLNRLGDAGKRLAVVPQNERG